MSVPPVAELPPVEIDWVSQAAGAAPTVKRQDASASLGRAEGMRSPLATNPRLPRAGKDFSVEVHTVPSDVPAAVDAGWFSLFNTPEFFGMHANGRRACFVSLRDDATQKIVGRVSFTEIAPGHFISPARGTFGGFETVSPDISLIERFVDETERHLADFGARTLEVALKPAAHAPALNATLLNVLTRRGYAMPVFDLSYALRVEPGALSEKMQRNNQKRLRKCQREKFVFARGETEAARTAAYAAIAENRAAKGYPMSMTYAQVATMAQVFPGKVHFFTVTKGDEVIAGSVCLQVSQHVLYVFYWGDRPGHETFSPVVLLAEGIYEFAQKNDFKLLDVGRSTDANVPNGGLITFKENLGFEASLKLTFRKKI